MYNQIFEKKKATRVSSTSTIVLLYIGTSVYFVAERQD